jgi:HEAT repeat protein
VQRPQAAPEAKPQPNADVTRLEARVLELEAEIQKVRSNPAKPGPEPSSVAIAEEIFKGYMELHRDKNPDPEKTRTLLARLGQLDEKSAAYFIEQYRKSKGPDLDDERETAMELALACGGASVADFVNVLLNDSTLDAQLRVSLLDELSGAGGGLFSIRRLPISEALGSTAMTLCRSSNADDRKGGAGLLGGVKSEASRTELRRLIEEDKDLSVRTSAILSLGHVGDHVSRTYLERRWTTPETKGSSGQSLAKFRNAIESALKDLAEGPR